MKKKILAILMATSLILTMGACGKKDEDKKTKKTEIDIENLEDLDEDELCLDCWWSKTNKDGSGFSYRFFEDGTGSYCSWAEEGLDGTYTTDFTYKLKGSKLTIKSDDKEISGKYSAYFKGKNLVLIDEDGEELKLKKEKIEEEPTEPTEEPTTTTTEVPTTTTEEPTTTTEEPSTTTTEEPTVTTTAEPTTTTTVATTDTTSPTSVNPDDYSSYDTRNLRNPNAVMAFQGLMKTNQYMFIDYNTLTEDPDMEGTFNTHVEGCVFTSNEDSDPALYAYLEFPFDYDFNAENLKLFKEAMSSGTTTTFTENGNFLIFEDSTWNTYGILDMQNRWCFMSELGEDNAFSKYAELAEMFGFEID